MPDHWPAMDVGPGPRPVRRTDQRRTEIQRMTDEEQAEQLAPLNRRFREAIDVSSRTT